MIRLINQTPAAMYVPTEDGYARIERARGVAWGSKFAGLFFFGDEWIFTICEIEMLEQKEPRT